MPEKLVRDRIPEIMSNAGVRPSIRILPAEQRLEWLLRKLGEETSELMAEPCLEECADVWEVLVAIAEELGASRERLLSEAEAKAAERGRFVNGYVLDAPWSSSK